VRTARSSTWLLDEAQIYEEGLPQGLKPQSFVDRGRAKPEGLAYLEAAGLAYLEAPGLAYLEAVPDGLSYPEAADDGVLRRTRFECARLVLLEVFHVAQVERFELLADLEEEEAEDEDADQHVERDAKLNHHGHSVCGARSSEE